VHTRNRGKDGEFSKGVADEDGVVLNKALQLPEATLDKNNLGKLGGEQGAVRAAEGDCWARMLVPSRRGGVRAAPSLYAAPYVVFMYHYEQTDP